MRIFCSICKDIFVPYSEVQVTNCGHLYHGSCISIWIKRNRTCPQCRTNLSQPFRVYFDVDNCSNVDSSTLEHQIEILSDKLREEEKRKKKLEESSKNTEKILEGMRECAMALNKKNEVLKTSVKALKEQVTQLTKQNEAVTHLQKEVEAWKNKVSSLQRIETLIEGSADAVNRMIKSTPITELAVKQLCTYVGVLKTQLIKNDSKILTLMNENRDLEIRVTEEKTKHSFELEEVINLRAKNIKLENELLYLTSLFKYHKEKNPEKKEESVLTQNKTTQMLVKTPSLNINLKVIDNVEDKSLEIIRIADQDQKINHWEELVRAGPSKNFGLSVKSRPLGKILHNRDQNDNENVLRSNSDYEFDGLGGRKKLRLGDQTPIQEFQKIKDKKKKDKKLAPAFQNKKIIEYYQID